MRCDFGAVLEVLREPGRESGTPLASSLPSISLCDSSPESSSKDSRKLFNPHLLSQTRTDVSVQFSRSRRRPAAGRRILAEPSIGVKRKMKQSFTFSVFFHFFAANHKRTRPAPPRGDEEDRPPVPLASRELHRMQGKECTGARGVGRPRPDRAEGGVRATPLPRSNRARCAKRRSAKEPP